MFERRINPEDDPLGSSARQIEDSAFFSMTSLVRQILASRDAELRNAEMAIEIQLLRRKLDLHRRYTASLSKAVEQALLALCRTPELEAEYARPAVTEPIADVERKSEASPRDNAPPQKPSPPAASVAASVDDDGAIGPVSDLPTESGASSASDAEVRADELLREATDILARAQESARQILERALSQGSEIVSRAEEQSNRLDEKMTEVEAVTAPSGATVFQRALELARLKGQAGAESGQDTEVVDDSSLLAQANAHRLVTTLKISSLKSFTQVVALEKAVRAIDGVQDVSIVSFRTGVLELVVEHESRAALEATLPALEGYRLRIVDSSDGRLWLEMPFDDQ